MRRKERKRESLRRRKHRGREKSGLIGSLSLEQPKRRIPSPSYKLVVNPNSGLAQQTRFWCAQLAPTVGLSYDAVVLEGLELKKNV